MIIIQFGQLRREGDASAYLLACLSGLKFILTGVAKVPFIRGEEILENFSGLLHNPGYCYLVKRDDVLNALSDKWRAAAAEVREKYGDMEYLPFKRRSCEIIM